jgi:hypothetical protein
MVHGPTAHRAHALSTPCRALFSLTRLLPCVLSLSLSLSVCVCVCVAAGTEVWWRTSQCGATQLSAAAPSELADEALEQWLKFFARGA